MKGLLAIPVWAGLVALPLAMTVGGMVRKAPESETIKTLLDSKIFWKLIYDLLFTCICIYICFVVVFCAQAERFPEEWRQNTWDPSVW